MRRAASTSEPRRALALLLLALAGAGCRAPAPVLAEELDAFDTRVRVEIRDAEPLAARAAFDELATALRRDSRDWHAWQPSELTRVNAALAAGEEVVATAPLLSLIARARPLHEASGGLFDPALGGLLEAWGFHTTAFPVTSPPPTRRRIDRWLERRPRFAELEVEGDRLRSGNRELQLDFGAVAEGAAAERALAILRRHGIRQARIAFGDGDAAVLGDGGGAAWTVNLRDPFGGSLGEITLRDGEALFSTGNFSKFRPSPTGARWPHILDPRTGFPAAGTTAVVVVDTDAVRADAGATALFVAGPSGFEATARAMGIRCAMLLTEENEMLVTAGLQPRLALVRDPVPLGVVDLGACR